jgi:hypothetical protein
MAKRNQTDNTMAKRNQTDNTTAKRKRTWINNYTKHCTVNKGNNKLSAPGDNQNP